MARPIYPHELADPDFVWLISTFREANPNLVAVEETSLPVSFVRVEPEEMSQSDDVFLPAVIRPAKDLPK